MSDLPEPLRAHPVDDDHVLSSFEWTVFFPMLDDLLRERRADSRQALQFLNCG